MEEKNVSKLKQEGNFLLQGDSSFEKTREGTVGSLMKELTRKNMAK